jgi:hypothetical protein
MSICIFFTVAIFGGNYLTGFFWIRFSIPGWYLRAFPLFSNFPCLHDIWHSGCPDYQITAFVIFFRTIGWLDGWLYLINSLQIKQWYNSVIICKILVYIFDIIYLRHADILKRTYLCQVSDTGSPEPLVISYCCQ